MLQWTVPCAFSGSGEVISKASKQPYGWPTINDMVRVMVLGKKRKMLDILRYLENHDVKVSQTEYQGAKIP